MRRLGKIRERGLEKLGNAAWKNWTLVQNKLGLHLGENWDQSSEIIGTVALKISGLPKNIEIETQKLVPQLGNWYHNLEIGTATRKLGQQLGNWECNLKIGTTTQKLRL